MVVGIVADIERVLAVAGDRGRAEPVELTAIKAGVDRGVLQVNASDATVVVVHGNVEHATAHFHGNRVAVGDVVVGIGRVGRPCAGTVAMRDDAFPELAEVREIGATDDQVRAVRPQFVKDVAGVAGQPVSGFPRGVPRVGVLVVASDTVFGSEQCFPVVLNNASDGEIEVGPRIDQGLGTVVEVEFEFSPSHPRVAIGGFVGRDAVDGSGGQDVGFPVGIGRVPSSDAA